MAKHIFRWWDKDDHLPHPLLWFIPPFLLEVLGVLLIVGLLYQFIISLLA